MKKLFYVIFLAVCISFTANAQRHHQNYTPDSLKFFQEIRLGTIFASSAQFSFPVKDGSRDFMSLHYNLFPDVVFSLPGDCYLVTMYGLGNNLLRFVVGTTVDEKRNIEFYSVGAHCFDDGGYYVAFGSQITKIIADGYNLAPFIEVGTDFENNWLFSFGLLMSVQYPAWKRP